MECPEAAANISEGDEVKVDFDTGVITDVTTGKEFHAAPFPPLLLKVVWLIMLTQKRRINNGKENCSCSW